MTTASRIFLLSPAHCGGKRAAILLREAAPFALAERLGQGTVTLGEAFSFLSGLYFRGKLTYAERFGAGGAAPLVITTNRGLLSASTLVTRSDLRDFGQVQIQAGEPRYRAPLVRDLEPLAADPAVEAVLLGSVATGKYVDVLLEALGERLLFPAEFVGRGDMSRGALMLRAARDGIELGYAPVLGTRRSGGRAARVGADR